MKWLKVLLTIAVILSLGMSIGPAFAFEGRGGERVVIEEGQTVEDDLFVGAREFVLKGVVKGDLIVAAQEIKIEKSGVVEGDLFAAGQTIEVNGKITDDIIAAGYAIFVDGDTSGDFIGAGFSVSLTGRLGQDFLFMGYQALVAGDVARHLRFSGNGIKLSGRIGGDAEISVGEAEEGIPPGLTFYSDLPPVPHVPPGLTIQEGARIEGHLRYTAVEEASIPPGAVGGKVEFKKHEPPRKEAPPTHARAINWGLDRLRYLVSLLLIGTLMLLIAPNWTQQLAGNIRAKPLPSLGWGIVTLVAFGLSVLVLVIAVVIVSLLLGLLTIRELVGWSLFTGFMAGAAALWGMGLTWIYLTRVLVGFALGMGIFRAFRSQVTGRGWWPLIVGAVILVLITSVPILGRLLAWAASLVGLGAFWLWAREKPSLAG
ncbi:MAG: hypothetical protein NZ653_02280 [Anaerolineae bacterium]|nr:hypothetical protein [Anaerolineae bacterium]